MKFKFLLFFFLFISVIYSQNDNLSNCNLQSENELWKVKFENTESKNEKIELIKTKIISDSIYRRFKPRVVTSHSKSVFNKYVDVNDNDCGCKILFVLIYKKNKFLTLDLNNNPELSKIIRGLNIDNINEIHFFFDIEISKSLYGETGKCGFIQITTKSREIRKAIKKLSLKLT